MAPGREAAEEAFGQFIEEYRAKYPKAVARLEKGRDALLTLYDFPAEHWGHLCAGVELSAELAFRGVGFPEVLAT